MNWQWVSFEELSREELYEVLKVRQTVFVVEQNCAYQDADDLDPVSWHLMGWHESTSGRKLVAYLRVVFPGKKYPEPSIGRVLTMASVRGAGLGQELMCEAISRTVREYPQQSIRISAQHYLEKFYSGLGFETVSDPYDEDGIPHIEMLRKAT